ncbi:hypothetical protein FJT64_005702 [Amphibalanus amphitrite]|uniref:Uncharacterized protein n=1 Tax=Amphibalanus amphitrite TaxID=1232801 RepID=A0A6A4VQD8_AMPAM|nr:hypothetical protein FJT64_005702 [Amphibalanus amphitrite]
MAGNPHIAYKAKPQQLYGSKAAIISMCLSLHANSTPAFPLTSQEADDINTLSDGKYYFIGAWRAFGDTKFTDMSSGRQASIHGARFWNETASLYPGESCLLSGYRSFIILPCVGWWMDGVICQMERPIDDTIGK